MEMILGMLFIIIIFVIIIIIPIGLILLLSSHNKKQDEEFQSRYQSEAYYKVTKIPYNYVRYDEGRYGEYLIYKYLQNYENLGAKFLFNIYVPTIDEETTEIDVLMISRKGLFVFESKNYSGWIFGDYTKKYWYQTLPQGRNGINKTEFYSPVFQNNTHIRSLKELLGKDIPMRSIITFSERCVLKEIKVNDGNINVIYRNQVCNLLITLYNSTSDILSQEQVEEIYNKLYPYTQVDYVTKLKHDYDVNAIKYNTHNSLKYMATDEIKAKNITLGELANESLYCPKCGGKLVLRKARAGTHTGETFYGCSNYPKCKYIKK